ncbi:MAG TPA: alpha/beta hydrolase [Candidatus Hydrogenedentes bacterium]|nr:alpha/beta hydrolase [Candidatus Hydrogenedentota bacterium]
MIVGCILLVTIAAVLLLAVYLLLHQVHGQTFDSAGVNIHYTDQGEGVPVILVHGYTANSDLNWRLPRIHAKLRKHFRVITMDVRGHGLSGKPHDASKYGIEIANDILRLMDHLKVPKAHLVGYSMGGFITLKFVAMHSERLISAMPCGAAWMAPGDPMCNLAIEIHAELAGKNGSSSSVGKGLTSLRRRLLGLFIDVEALGCLAEGFKELAVTEEELRKVTIPVMAVKGGNDQIVPSGRPIKGILPDFQEIIIPGGRHNTVIFNSEFQNALIKFLLDHSPK